MNDRFGIYGAVRPGDGAAEIRGPEPEMCGGSRTTRDDGAPTEIKSNDMYLFSATSALGGMALAPQEPDPGEKLGYISAFAAKADGGFFLFLEKRIGFGQFAERQVDLALVKEDVFPSLCAIVRECGLAKRNGFHSYTNGLPENFGGSVTVMYSSGEKIGFSNNQSPIISPVDARRISSLFGMALKGERVPLPRAEALKEIRFDDKRENGGFTRAALTLLPDGTAVNKKACRYEGTQVYESEKPVDAETVAFIKRNIDNNCMLAWSGLPESGFRELSEKTLTFVFAGGKEIAVRSGLSLPAQISGAFFNIELEMTTKH